MIVNRGRYCLFSGSTMLKFLRVEVFLQNKFMVSIRKSCRSLNKGGIDFWGYFLGHFGFLIESGQTR